MFLRTHSSSKCTLDILSLKLVCSNGLWKILLTRSFFLSLGANKAMLLTCIRFCYGERRRNQRLKRTGDSKSWLWGQRKGCRTCVLSLCSKHSEQSERQPSQVHLCISPLMLSDTICVTHTTLNFNIHAKPPLKVEKIFTFSFSPLSRFRKSNKEQMRGKWK